MSDWPRRPLADVAESTVDGPFGSALKSEHYVEDPGVRVVRLANLGDGHYIDSDDAYIADDYAKVLARHDVRAGDVLVASLGDQNHRPGRACLYPAHYAPGIVKADCFRIRPAPFMEPGFLAESINAKETVDQIRRLAQGVTRDRVNLSQLRKVKVPTPRLEEQRQIVKVLNAVDQAIQSAKRIVAKYEAAKSGILVSTVWSRVDRGMRTALGELAMGGPRGMVIGPFGSDLTVRDYRDSGVPVFFVRDVHALQPLEHRSKVFVSEEKAAALSAHWVNDGDVVITKMGLPPGIASFHSGNISPGIITADLIRLRPNVDLVDPRWLALALNGPPVRQQVEAITAGVTRPKVTLRDFRLMSLVVPPLNMQLQQLAEIDALDQLISLEREIAAKWSVVRAGLAADLLSGQVRVGVGV